MDSNNFKEEALIEEQAEGYLSQPTPKQGVLWSFGFLLLIVFSSVVYILLFMAFQSLGLHNAETGSMQQSIPEHLVSLNGITGVYFVQFFLLLPIIFSISNFENQRWYTTLAVTPITFKVIWLWAAVWAVYQVLVVAVDSIIEIPVDEFILQMEGSKHLGITLTVVLLAPVLEELIFRGYLFKAWRHSWLGFSGTLVVTSFLFTLMHLGQYNLVVLSQLFVFAMILGVAREKTGSLLAPIFIHSLNNLFSIVMVSYVGFS